MTIVSKVCKSTSAGNALPIEFESILIKEIQTGLIVCLFCWLYNVPSFEKYTFHLFVPDIYSGNSLEKQLCLIL